MASAVLSCPYCGVEKAFFSLTAETSLGGIHWAVTGICSSCHSPVMFIVRDSRGRTSVITYQANVSWDSDYSVKATYPKGEVYDIPEHLPENAAETFKEGCKVLVNSATGACMLFRKALELALKDLSPDIEAWKLEKRIDRMAAQNLITPALKEWAHQLRIDSNEVVHGEGVTKEFAQSLQNLTRFILIYTHTLPKQVELAQAKKEA